MCDNQKQEKINSRCAQNSSVSQNVRARNCFPPAIAAWSMKWRATTWSPARAVVVNTQCKSSELAEGCNRTPTTNFSCDFIMQSYLSQRLTPDFPHRDDIIKTPNHQFPPHNSKCTPSARLMHAEISEQTEFLNVKTLIHQNNTTGGTKASRAHITKTTVFVLSHSQLEAHTEAVRTVTMTLLKILSQPLNDLHGQISFQECRSIINLYQSVNYTHTHTHSLSLSLSLSSL